MKINSAFYSVLFSVLMIPLLLNCKKEPILEPTLEISEVTNITSTTAVCGGVFTNGGSSNVNNRGVCWSVNASPTIADSKTSNGGGIGSFVSNINGLKPGTTYNIRAFATNSNGTGYSSQSTFSTLALAPVLTTNALTAVTSSTATSGGNITNDGGSPITARGVCWSNLPNPTTVNSKTSDGTGSGNFVSSITGLTPGLIYYTRAYATNSVGTSYGNQVTTSITAVFPTITTTSILAFTSTTATSGGIIISDGGAAITARGVCWSTNQNPTTLNNKTIDGTGTSNYTSSITGLNPGTSYYVRAYAINSIGISYGNQVTLTTIASIPTITTTLLSTITSSTATSGGNITSDGGSLVTLRGVCWSLTQSPTTANSKTTDGTGSGSFTSSIIGMASVTKYYFRAYATNSIGTAYGNEVSATTTANLPVVSTTSISAITSTTVTSGGNITDNGGAAVSARGVCWSTTQSPTTTNSKTTDGNGSGIFTSSIMGLTPLTKYYFRAYAINSIGTVYGNEITATTTGNLPVITTSAVSSITSSTAISGGNITDDGGATISARGVCWSTTSNPTILNTKTNDGTGSGSFTSSITGLSIGITYFIRAYATNNIGTSYGIQASFTTSSFVIGQSYQGGVIAYIFQPSDPGYISGQTHGLIVTPSNQSTSIQWWNGSHVTTGATGTALGTGNSNTNTIVTKQGIGNYAAKLCSDLVLGGYSDWYLPSKDELNKIYISKVIIGGFINGYYWSSSENSNLYAWIQGFNDGYQAIYGNESLCSIRAVRTF